MSISIDNLVPNDAPAHNSFEMVVAVLGIHDWFLQSLTRFQQVLKVILMIKAYLSLLRLPHGGGCRAELAAE
jgi:hypothetical protein